MSNRLAKETSPYLLQHKDNPVDWYPWGEEALSRAKKENKPILLSIGYSACHWCHVMEHECFEDSAISELMNGLFVNIKVDREERPDLDHIYQNVAQALTRSGGWPLTVFLTPDLKPFFGGTYFPPEDRYGRPGFPRVLQALSEAFKNDYSSVVENAEKLTDFISKLESISSTEQRLPTKSDFQGIATSLLEHFDWQEGGFGNAPKFPNPMALTFLWRYGLQSGEQKSCDAALLALKKMAQGGIYDQLGGGFHRYSVDASWSVPHFEKMLYDNALLLKLYSEVLCTAEDRLGSDDRKFFEKVIVQTISYVFREMTAPTGGFYSAQDADSEGEEGKFFVWDPVDLKSALSESEFQVFSLRYGVTEAGNFEHGKTVLYIARSISEISKELKISESEVNTVLDRASKHLLEVRFARIAPQLDNKILTSWNALMVSGLAWSAYALSESHPELSQSIKTSANQAFQFLKTHLSQGKGRLYSTFQAGKAKGNAYLDDYAFMSMAALDLSRFASKSEEVSEYVKNADQWVQTILKHFKDRSDETLGYYFTSDDHETLIQRPKTITDQAIPSGVAVALESMSILTELSDEQKGEEYSKETTSQLNRLFPLAEQNAFGFGETLCFGMLMTVGPIAVMGTAMGNLNHQNWTSPYLFQKPSQGATPKGRFLVCHQKTCREIKEGDSKKWIQDTAKLD